MSASEQVPVVAQELVVSVPRDFKSILYKTKGSNKIVSFSFGDASTETTLQILGLAIVLFTTGPALATGPQVGGILKTLWGKLVVLKRPSDSDAIDLLEALIRVRARNLASHEDVYPTTSEIQAEADLPAESARLAFTKLKSTGVIKVAAWGGQREDISDGANRWAVKL